MSVTEETLNTIHARLQELSTEATPDQLAYLAKAYQTIAGSGKMLDIAHLADQKIDELIAEAETQVALLEAAKNTAIESVTTTKDEFISDLSTATSTNLTQINTLVTQKKSELEAIVGQFDDVNDVPTGSTIMTEIEKEGKKQKFVQDGALPFVYGILSRYNDYYGTATFTSDLGSWYNSTSGANYMLALLAGCHTYTTSYAGFYKEPSLCFLQGQRGIFIQKEQYLKYGSTSSQYTYPYAAIGVLFVKNTTDAPITKTFYYGGSSYWSSGYEGAGVFIGVPNETNENAEDITSLTWTNLYSYSSSSYSFSNSSSFTVPAHKTVALLLYTSSYYYTTTSSYYVQFLEWYIYDFRSSSLSNTGLEIDVDRTLKAWQCKGLTYPYEIWK